MRLIKRYPNRKLYDTSARQYVTLQEISQMVTRGETIQVVDTRTGQDVTKGALSKIVLEKEKGGGGLLPPVFLTDLLKRGGRSVMGYIRSTIHLGQNAASWVEEEVDRSVKGLVRLGKLAVGDANGFRSELLSKIRERLAAEELGLDRRLKEALERAFRAVNLPTKGEVDRLRDRLAGIEARVDELINPGARRPRRGGGTRVRVRDVSRRG